ncbi:MAG: hypothetical protein GKR94_25685 [Gammaproteobacteria bacterium]|nr:hypothetical protein [Gammaproteobacteria bacterium]
MSPSANLRAVFSQAPPRQFPPEIERALLRADGAWRFGSAVAAIVGTLGFVLFLPLSLVDTFRLDINAVRTSAEVVSSVYQQRAVANHAFMRRKKLFLVTFSYTDHDGRRQRAQSLAARDLRPGEKVEVEYHNDTTGLARVAGGFFVPGGYWAGVWAMIFPALAIFGRWNFRRWRQRRGHLLKFGLLAAGRIEQLWQHGPRDGGTGWVALRFSAAGNSVQHTQSVDGPALEAARSLARGDGRLTVLYDERLPRHCIVLELNPALLTA